MAALAQSTLLMLLVSHAGASYSQTDVRSLDNATRQPFQAELRRLRVRTAGAPESFRVTEVPAGKRLVIEHVSFRIRSPLDRPSRASKPPQCW